MTAPPEWPPRDAQQLVWCVSAPPDGRPLLAAVVKRSYVMGEQGLSLADEQVPLVVEPEVEVADEALPSWLRDDTDLLAPKPATDVVVLGAAHAPEPTEALDVSVAVGRSARRLRVQGPRHVEIGDHGRPVFSSPEPFASVELSPHNAYGGRDRFALWVREQDDQGRRLIDLPEQLRPQETVWLYEYPRNPVGKGFFIDVELGARLDGAPLPQIEDPGDLLTPERLLLPAPTAWIDAPIPGLLGWVHHSWFPRLVRYVGRMLDHDPPERGLREASFADGDDLELDLEPAAEPRVSPRALQGASAGLAVERLRGDELVVLEHLHPRRPHIELSLPAERPSFRLRPTNVASLSPPAILQTVRLEPDRERLSLTWVGAVPLLGKVDADFLMDTELEVSWHRL